MDSSRGGPLSTLILLLPLVIVPAVAILRPADPDSGLIGDDLTASEDAFMSGPEDFEAIFGDLDAESASLDSEERYSSTREVPFVDHHSAAGRADSGVEKHRQRVRLHQLSESHAHGRNVRVEQLPDLSDLGVTSSLWFNPGTSGGFGFVAFVPTEKDSVRYRFSSIQETEEGAVDDVTQQIRIWWHARRDSSVRSVQ
jgi:hypothetical protein